MGVILFVVAVIGGEAITLGYLRDDGTTSVPYPSPSASGYQVVAIGGIVLVDDVVTVVSMPSRMSSWLDIVRIFVVAVIACRNTVAIEILEPELRRNPGPSSPSFCCAR